MSFGRFILKFQAMTNLFSVSICAQPFQLCPTLCDPTDCSLPGSSVHGILQQEYSSVLSGSTGDLPNPGIEPMSPMFPALAGRFFATSATWEAPLYLQIFLYE